MHYRYPSVSWSIIWWVLLWSSSFIEGKEQPNRIGSTERKFSPARRICRNLSLLKSHISSSLPRLLYFRTKQNISDRLMGFSCGLLLIMVLLSCWIQGSLVWRDNKETKMSVTEKYTTERGRAQLFFMLCSLSIIIICRVYLAFSAAMCHSNFIFYCWKWLHIILWTHFKRISSTIQKNTTQWVFEDKQAEREPWGSLFVL